MTADATSEVTAATWSGSSLTLSSPLGAEQFAYDASGRLLRVSGSLPGVSQHGVRRVGNRIASVDALGRETDYHYDALNRVTAVVEPDPTTGAAGAGPSTAFVYDAAGNTVGATDPLGHTTFYAYDRANRLVVTADASSQVTSATWTATTLTLASPLGGESFAYDSSGSVVHSAGVLPGVSSTVYDGNGNQIAATDPLGRQTQFHYDALNRLTSVVEPNAATGVAGSGPVTAYAYDAVGNLRRLTDPDGFVTQYLYDQMNRRIETIDPNGSPLMFAYDGEGKLTSVTDALNNVVTYTFNEDSWLVAETDPFNVVKRYAYDADGRLVELTDALGRKTSYSYDAVGRATGEIWHDTSGAVTNTITRTYDGVGELRAVSDVAATYTLDYDALGRMTRIDNAGSPGLQAVALAYTYDADGNITQVGATVGGLADWTTSYGYDAVNRVVSVSQTGGEAVDKRVTFTYNGAGQLTAEHRYASSVTAAIASTYAYDADGRPTAISYATLWAPWRATRSRGMRPVG